MARLYLVRHGQAAGHWSHERNPGLSQLGHQQAEACAKDLIQALPGALPIITSPLLRCQETAQALVRHWQIAPQIEPRVCEIPSPAMADHERASWLRGVMRSDWSKLASDNALSAWRHALLAYLKAQQEDKVIFTHFVAINVAVGYALGHEQVVVFRPANTSCSVMETAPKLKLVTQGVEDDSLVL